MIPLEFQKKHLAEYSKFLNSEMGKDFIATLEELRMGPSCDAQPHIAHYRLGGIAGYEECLSKIIKLAIFIPEKIEPKMDYGHSAPPPKEENKE